MTLYTYRIPVDDGAAPNPFWGSCTLAICKPQIRRVAQPGDWVAGLGAKRSWDGQNHEGTLVYVMRVDEVLTFDEYDQQHPEKRPEPRSQDWRKRLGDSLYYPTRTSYGQRAGGVHGAESREHDLNGRFVLVSRKFLYFGAEPLNLPPQLLDRVDCPRQGHRTSAGEVEADFVAWLNTLPRRWWNTPRAEPQTHVAAEAGRTCSPTNRVATKGQAKQLGCAPRTRSRTC